MLLHHHECAASGGGRSLHQVRIRLVRVVSRARLCRAPCVEPQTPGAGAHGEGNAPEIVTALSCSGGHGGRCSGTLRSVTYTAEQLQAKILEAVTLTYATFCGYACGDAAAGGDGWIRPQTLRDLEQFLIDNGLSEAGVIEIREAALKDIVE